MIKYTDIKTGSREDERGIIYRAQVILTAEKMVAKEEAAQQLAVDHAKRRCREYIAENLYGQVRQDARTAYEELRRFVGMDGYEVLQRVMAPLLAVGEGLVKPPNEDGQGS